MYGDLGVNRCWIGSRYNPITFSMIKGNLELALLLMDAEKGPRWCDYFSQENFSCHWYLVGFEDLYFPFISVACLFGNLAIVEKALTMPNLLTFDPEGGVGEDFCPGLLECIFNNDLQILQRLLPIERFNSVGVENLMDLAIRLNRTDMIKVLEQFNSQV
jgi:hypothetical protein